MCKIIEDKQYGNVGRKLDFVNKQKTGKKELTF